MQPSSHNLLKLRGPLKRRQGTGLWRWFFSWPSALLLLVLCVFAASGAWGAYQKDALAREKLEEARAERDEMLSRHHALEDELEMLKSPLGKEAALRKQYDVGRQGEELVVIVDTASAVDAPPAEPSTIRRFFGMFW